MRGNDPVCLESVLFLLVLEGTESLGNPLVLNLIPKLILLYTSGRQGKTQGTVAYRTQMTMEKSNHLT